MGSIIPGAIRLRVFGFVMAIALVGTLAASIHAAGSEKKINTDHWGVAIKGYDTVAYFTERRAVKGKKDFEYEWQDAKWRFSSAANRDKFAADPQAYAPKYGGF